MSEPTREEALAHFGVKGMKWGVRTSAGASGSSKPEQPVQRSNTVKAHVVTAAKVATAIALILAADTAVKGAAGKLNASQTQAGRDFVISNPKLMKSKPKHGVYKITTL